MEILRGKQYKSKIQIGDAPIGTVFILRSYSPIVHPNNVRVFQYDMHSVSKFKRHHVGYSNEFLTETDLHNEFMEMFENV